jgi:hypothetical protein
VADSKILTLIFLIILMQFNLKKNTHLYELFMRQLKEIAGRYTQFLFFILFIGREN